MEIEPKLSRSDLEYEVPIYFGGNIFRWRIIVVITSDISFISEVYCVDKYNTKYMPVNQYSKNEMHLRAVNTVVGFVLKEKNVVVETQSRFKRTNSLKPVKEPKVCQACSKEMFHIDGRKFKCINLKCEKWLDAYEMGN